MTGIKGRSGLAETPEAREARAAAGRASGAARRAKASAPNEGADPTATAPDTLGGYDQLVGLPKSWADAIKREQLVGEMQINEQRELALEKERAQLFSREEVIARDARWNAAMGAQAELVFRLLDSLEGVSPTLRIAYLERVKEWRRTLSETMQKVPAT